MKSYKDSVLMLCLCALIAALCGFSAEAKAGALDGIRLCEEIIIPSLLPVVIICNIIILSRASLGTEAVFGKLFESVFRLPKCTSSAVILGLIGGYPTGALLTLRLYKTGAIDEATAARLMHFCFCGGIAFTVSAVGTATYGSVKFGLLLLGCCILSSIIILAFGAIKKPKPSGNDGLSYRLNLSDALCEGVEASVKALAIMSAYIVLFSAVYKAVRLPAALAPILEITSGVCNAEGLLPLPYCAFFLSFGGICIHFQLFGFLKQMKIKYLDFLTYRMLNALISFGVMKLYLFLFPQSAEVFSNLAEPRHSLSSGGIALSLVMIIGCAVVIFDIENRKIKLI